MSSVEHLPSDEVSDDEASINNFFEDMLDAVEESDSDGSEDGYASEQLLSEEKCREMRTYLRAYGEQKFLKKYLLDNKSEASDPSELPIREVLYALGIRSSLVLEDLDETTLVQLLQLAITRELRRRISLDNVTTLDDVISLIKNSKNIVLLTGAGISTSLGIPDFRSDSGIYRKLEAMGLSEPQEVFDLHVFREDPSIFYTFSKEILPTVTRFSPTHAFIKLIQDNGKLLTNYTQNIDNLESHAGISTDKLVQCHGSFASATCQTCGHKVPGQELFPDIRMGVVSHCKLPASADADDSSSSTRKRKRKAAYDEDEDEDDDDDDQEQAVQESTLAGSRSLCNGVMKPDITFFGEALPKTFETRLLGQDIDKCDMLICIGTSLKVAPVSEIIMVLPAHIPQIYISRTPCTHAEFDVSLLGNCDDVVEYICTKLGHGWELKHEMITENGFNGEVAKTGERTYKFTRPSDAEGKEVRDIAPPKGD
ncbi:DHS-like NAD/FAD-binding domain-containing protein [Lipomyces kononenkoae]|uniref:DHS-like NAD/FAD-binding domain-containing protein n=1 Tax=Lipomyces kononenkoae TaxID=34357 RepID=A0ACC3TBR3_LIPKO